VILTGGAFDNMVNYTRRDSAGRTVVEARFGSTLNLPDISVTRNFPFGDVIDVPPDDSIFFGNKGGEDSQLNLENSAINNSYGAGAISWNGGTATGGDDLSQTNRIQALPGGEANVLASTVLYDAFNTSSNGCNSGIAYGCNGMPLMATVDGVLNFESSAALPLNTGFVFPGKDSYSEFSFGDLVAGDYSYIAATEAQDANDVRTLFGNLSILTEGLAYDLVETGVPEIAFLFDQLVAGAIPALDGILTEAAQLAFDNRHICIRQKLEAWQVSASTSPLPEALKAKRNPGLPQASGCQPEPKCRFVSADQHIGNTLITPCGQS
jgi:hypothetical protein